MVTRWAFGRGGLRDERIRLPGWWRAKDLRESERPAGVFLPVKDSRTLEIMSVGSV